jgi:hypothetical protein
VNRSSAFQKLHIWIELMNFRWGFWYLWHETNNPSKNELSGMSLFQREIHDLENCCESQFLWLKFVWMRLFHLFIMLILPHSDSGVLFDKFLLKIIGDSPFQFNSLFHTSLMKIIHDLIHASFILDHFDFNRYLSKFKVQVLIWFSFSSQIIFQNLHSCHLSKLLHLMKEINITSKTLIQND